MHTFKEEKYTMSVCLTLNLLRLNYDSMLGSQFNWPSSKFSTQAPRRYLQRKKLNFQELKQLLHSQLDTIHTQSPNTLNQCACPLTSRLICQLGLVSEWPPKCFSIMWSSTLQFRKTSF